MAGLNSGPGKRGPGHGLKTAVIARLCNVRDYILLQFCKTNVVDGATVALATGISVRVVNRIMMHVAERTGSGHLWQFKYEDDHAHAL